MTVEELERLDDDTVLYKDHGGVWVHNGYTGVRLPWREVRDLAIFGLRCKDSGLDPAGLAAETEGG